MFAKEPQMVSKTDAERYGYETYAERAEKLNGRTAMLGFVAAVVSYATTGSLFFFEYLLMENPFLKFLLIMLLVGFKILIASDWCPRSILLSSYSNPPFKIPRVAW